VSVLPRAALEYPQPRPGAATSRGCEVLADVGGAELDHRYISTVEFGDLMSAVMSSASVATGTGLSENDEALVWTAPARGASLRSHQGSHENALPVRLCRS